MKVALTIERLRKVLFYDRTTGVFTWRIKPNRRIRIGAEAGCIFRDRCLIKVDGVQYRAHRLAWFYVHGVWPKDEIDHRDGISSRNPITNLRDVTHQINLQNKHRATIRSHLGVLGVGKNVNGNKFRARIDHRHLGSFDTIEAAQAAYLSAKRQFHEGCTL